MSGLEEYWRWVAESQHEIERERNVDQAKRAEEVWIDVSERLPEHGQKVLIRAHDGTVTAAMCDTEFDPSIVWWDQLGVYGAEREWSWWWEHDDRFQGVTHWMPLPDGPELPDPKG